ncbi:hypothetical protein, partial [Klebsiella grimontii]|uniref:hypothetical protein n=1 Tax=Klebsiella grimontii TaxID=2058152 RepID=UPI001CCE0D6E
YLLCEENEFVMFVGKRGVRFSNIFACQRDRLITESTRQRSFSGLFHDNNLLLMPEFSGAAVGRLPTICGAEFI